jgi:hypothetical protein
MTAQHHVTGRTSDMVQKFITLNDIYTRKLEAPKMRFRPDPVAQINISIHTILQVTNIFEDIAQCQQKWKKLGKDGQHCLSFGFAESSEQMP